MNMDSIIKAHNAMILNDEDDNNSKHYRTCNCTCTDEAACSVESNCTCRDEAACPVESNCTCRDEAACPVESNCLKNDVL